MIQLYQLDDTPHFPPIKYALDDPNGLLAFGGDLSVERLVQAYQSGIFPWFNVGEPILWWSPDPRAILLCDEFHCSNSLRKLMRKETYTVTLNTAFAQVIEQCANIPRRHDVDTRDMSVQTWITSDMIAAYIRLHHAGYAHSVEVWEDGKLVGGLYGVGIGSSFAGESMFHRKPNTSKLALAALTQHLKSNGIDFIDCQIHNPHLASLGARCVPRHEFLAMLKEASALSPSVSLWQSQRISY
ncbi:leucyl/phenylalanyl-tRNA--protein transferase [Alteromonas facilis]|uniref:leucyl/phenylalanyl-tRNA--protein transferase n=1 Tax=Alteromonas facilis TaxID=2048004 RepID=UPI000C293FCF|nr:leucyl/phenylalanyl-tRNA--protein transferase [Alteromonas facilis]